MEGINRRGAALAATCSALAITTACLWHHFKRPLEGQRPAVAGPERTDENDKSHKARVEKIRKSARAKLRPVFLPPQPKAEGESEEEELARLNNELIEITKDAESECRTEGYRSQQECDKNHEDPLFSESCEACMAEKWGTCAEPDRSRCLKAHEDSAVCFDLGNKIGDDCWRNYQADHPEEMEAVRNEYLVRLAGFLNAVENDRPIGAMVWGSTDIFLERLNADILGPSAEIGFGYFVLDLNDIGYTLSDFRRIFEKFVNKYLDLRGENWARRESIFGAIGFMQDTATGYWIAPKEFPVELKMRPKPVEE